MGCEVVGEEDEGAGVGCLVVGELDGVDVEGMCVGAEVDGVVVGEELGGWEGRCVGFCVGRVDG